MTSPSELRLARHAIACLAIGLAFLYATCGAQRASALMAVDWDECEPINLFEAIELSAIVALVEVPQGRGVVRSSDLHAVEGLKGAAPSQINLRDTAVTRGGRYLAFLDANGTALTRCSTLPVRDVDLASMGTNEAAVVGAAREWIAHPEARRSQLVRLASLEASMLAAQAANALSNAPELVRDLTREERAQLVRALDNGTSASEPARSTARITGIARVLARTHAIEAVPAIVARMTDHNVSARLLQDSLELLTNHHDPNYTPYRDPSAAHLQLMQEGWRRFYDAHRNDSPDALVAAGFRERGLAPGARADRAVLAAALVRAPDALTRVVVLERCERVKRASYAGGLVAWLHRDMGPALGELGARFCAE